MRRFFSDCVAAAAAAAMMIFKRERERDRVKRGLGAALLRFLFFVGGFMRVWRGDYRSGISLDSRGE